jgi:hypothetical protein
LNAVRWLHGDPNLIVRKILEQSVYHGEITSAQPPEPTLWERLWAWIVEHGHQFFEQFVRFLSLFQGSRGAETTLEFIMFGIGGAVLVWLVVRMGSLHVRRLPRGEALGEALPPQRDADAWRRLSEREAEKGRYAAAVAALFMAALRLLDERGVFTFDPARTPNEYRRLIARALTAASPAFDRLASCFVRATYASGLPLPGEYETASAAYVAFASEVPS